jgi:trans-AT polyketide synthase/acyltransferase/oxidoreductase domain-containing protein
MNEFPRTGFSTDPALSAPWQGLVWRGPREALATDEVSMRAALLKLDQPLWIVEAAGCPALAAGGEVTNGPASVDTWPLRGYLPACPPEALGDPAYRATYGVRVAFYAGAMAGAIASEALVIALGKAGLMGSFGAGGCSPRRVEAAIQQVQAELPHGPYAFNLLNSPNEPATEQRVAELYIQYGVPVVEASAYLDLSAALVQYRLAGLSLGADGQVVIGHHVIAKVSRKEVARKFLAPAPPKFVTPLLEQGRITPQQAEWAQRVPMADDVTVEADSGGHTDNRPLVSLLPTLLALRDELQAQYQFARPVRIGAAGGISTPHAALGAFTMGAAYVVSGSANQATLEAGASEHTRQLLSKIDMADVAMAPAADMFEMGVKVQVVRRGTMFAQRASKLYEIYSRYDSWEAVPPAEQERLEKPIFKRSYAEIWADTEKFFAERDPRQLERAAADLHHQMALVFRWYLGLSSRWSNTGEPGREMDYQIWCGPSMGAFNDWAHGSYLEAPENRRVVDVNLQILTGAAYLSRVRALATQGVTLPPALLAYVPQAPLA